MVHVTGRQDCGHSPKNLFAQNVAIALETGEVPAGMLSDVVWHGLDAVRQTMANGRPSSPS